MKKSELAFVITLLIAMIFTCIHAINDKISEECYTCTHNIRDDDDDDDQKRGVQKLTASLLGNAADSAAGATLGKPVLVISGGSTDVDRTYQTSIDLVRGCYTDACASKSDLTIFACYWY